MAKGSTHQSSEFVKAIYLGTSGSGKTGSLVSLVNAGYQLRVLDLDNGLDALVGEIKRQCPDKLDALDYITLQDNITADKLRGAKVQGSPKAYTDAIKYMTKWDDESTPSEWGTNTIFALDSLTLFGRAAKRWAEGMNPTAKDPRQWYGAAQESITTVLDMLTSKNFRAHVLILTHIDMTELPDGTVKGYASSIGKALGPKLPAVFNNMILAESRGTGENVKRTIATMPTNILELKTARSHTIPKSLPLNTGMATIFEELLK